MNRLRSAERVVAIDGCATDCARKVAEAAGLTLTRSITLATDCGIRKVPFREHLDVKDPAELVSKEDLRKATEAIVEAIEE